jgi:ABC-type sugar transport system ATPase subunit
MREIVIDQEPAGAPLAVQVQEIVKRYGSTRALDGCSFEVRAGEVHGLVGANGAGKSTLVKALSGAISPDGGVVSVGDWSGSGLNPRLAQSLGIATIYQDPDLVPEFTVAQNIALGHEPSQLGGFQDRRAETRAAERVVARVGLPREAARRRVGEMSRAEQQLVEIAKALHREARVILMDEPTAPLGPAEAATLEGVIRSVAVDGVAIVYISHRLPELVRVCDRVTVIREGRRVLTRAVAEVTEDEVVEAMTGGQHAPVVATRVERSHEVLRLERVSQGSRLREVSLTVHAGEVVALAGLVGAGRSRLLRLVLGEGAMSSGSMTLNGEPYAPSGAPAALRRGVALVPEDRKSQGLFLDRDVVENVMFASPAARAGGLLKRAEERRRTREWIDRFQIVPPDPDRKLAALSGGNQQKVLMARWLNSGVKLLLIDEATEGVDVAARADIVRIVRETAAQGTAVLAAASESEELFAMADRILVMRAGAIVAEADPDCVTEQEIVALASGAKEVKA